MTAIAERRELELKPDESICPACASGCHDAPEMPGPFKCDCGCHAKRQNPPEAMHQRDGRAGCIGGVR